MNAGLLTPGEKERRIGDMEARGDVMLVRGGGDIARVASGLS